MVDLSSAEPGDTVIVALRVTSGPGVCVIAGI